MIFKEMGYLEITIPKKFKSKAMDAILKSGLSYRKAVFTGELDLKLIISASNLSNFKSILDDIPVTFSKSMGILANISKYKQRLGILIGALFLVLSVYISSLFIWNFNIQGNENVSEEEIIAILEKSGCKLGTFIPSIDYDKLHNEFLLESNNISWISVNISGNVANVFVEERMKEENNDKALYTNVVSKYDAQILSVQLYNGKKMISVNDVVKKGDLLISGIMNSQSQGVRYVHADGVVKAYVNKPILVKIPLDSSKKVYTNRVSTQKSVKIFSKNINFLLNYRNPYILCDTIEESKSVHLFGKIKLPITITTTFYKEYENQDVSYSYEQAVDIAFSKLRYEMDSALDGAELVSKSVTTYYDDEAFYVECNLYCIENIAQIVKVEVK